MAYSQNNRIASISGSAISDHIWLYQMTGSEQLGRLFEYELELLSDSDSYSLSKLLGSTVVIELELADKQTRYFNGLVTKVSQHGMLGKLYVYRATVHPKVWLLTRASNCRIMPMSLTVPNIVKKILSEHGYTDIKSCLQGNYSTREYCVQYRETDFNFISRLLEEEGIYYYFQHTESAHTMVLCDSTDAHDDMPGDAIINYFSSGSQADLSAEYLSDWVMHQEIRTGSYQLNDFDFTSPSADLLVTSSLPGEHDESDKKVYDYPGGYVKASESNSKSTSVHQDGNQYVKIRMQEHRAEHESVNAQGNVKGLAVGATFSLSGYPRDDQNRKYLVLSSYLHIQNNGYVSLGIQDSSEAFHCSYNVLSTDYTFRPARITRVPVVHGVQTAIVVGNSGEEITTDKYGRVKVQFHWDRLGKKDQNSSCWIRVAHVWAGKNWGGVFIPRIGQEVIVDFLEGNPDRPIIIGSVYNDEQNVPYELPSNKTQSGIKSRSSLSGTSENFNELRFEDKKDAEEIYIHAEKDFTRIVENDDKLKVGFEKKSAGDQTVDIYNNRTVTLDQGNDLLAIKKGDRAVTLDQGNHKLTVSMGDHIVKVNTGKIAEEAMQSIELKVGENSIKIDQMGVTIKGMMISIQGQVQTEVKGTMTTVNGDAMLTVKGGIVMIN